MCTTAHAKKMCFKRQKCIYGDHKNEICMQSTRKEGRDYYFSVMLILVLKDF